jgi:hypothetical protein
MAKYILKRFSYTKSALIGAAGGTVIGAGIGALKKKKKGETKKDKKKRILKGALIGAGVGAGLGAGSEYLSGKYKDFIGPVKEKVKEEKPSLNQEDFEPGDIIIADRGIMKHYGVVIDKEGNIIEYGSKKRDPRMASVRKVNIKEFKGDSPLSKEAPSGKFSREEIIKRAEERLGKDNGKYNLRNNNCEHFARGVVNGDKRSTQVDERIDPLTNEMINRMRKAVTPKNFSDSSESVKGEAMDLLNEQKELLKKKLLLNGGLFNIRKNLTKKLGGLSHFDKYQTSYLTGGGALIGSLSGSLRAKKKAKKEAEESGLDKDSLAYKHYIKNRTNEGIVKGGLLGAGVGFGASKAKDAALGKVLSDKIRAKHGQDLKPIIGKNYMGFGKAMRGIHSEDKVDKIINNWKEIGDFGKGVYEML